uniref:DM2 domain-containing protein n=1 Tax=Araucaria cunninghamii TaxID=56994 RepID=A0A0D6R516_ARACU
MALMAVSFRAYPALTGTVKANNFQQRGRLIQSPPLLVTCATRKPGGSGGGRGITQPRPLSPEMQKFLGVPEIPRTQAIKKIWEYIKENNLQDPANKKEIVCDENLKSIFGGRERINFLEISGLLNPHFIKN